MPLLGTVGRCLRLYRAAFEPLRSFDELWPIGALQRLQSFQGDLRMHGVGHLALIEPSSQASNCRQVLEVPLPFGW